MKIEINDSLLYDKIQNIDFNTIDFTYISHVIDNMTRFVVDNKALGLAANQIALNLRLFVMIDYENHIPYHLINPVITSRTPKKQIHKEGCLSFKDLMLDIKRNEEVQVQYETINGKSNIKIFSNVLSICAQHEIDHLNGITFIKRANRKIKI